MQVVAVHVGADLPRGLHENATGSWRGRGTLRTCGWLECREVWPRRGSFSEGLPSSQE